jgi:hypothetical protein
MISCTTSAVWNRPVSSPYYTEHGQRRGAVLSDHITTIAMYMSGQLDQRCTVEPNCSGMSARFADASVTHERALETCEASCVLRAAKTFFVPVVHSPLGAGGYVTVSELSSRGDRARSHRTRDSSGAAFSQKTGAGAQMTHDGPGAAPSQEAEDRATGTCGAPEAVLSREAGVEATRTRGGLRAALSREVGADGLGTHGTRASPYLLC